MATFKTERERSREPLAIVDLPVLDLAQEVLGEMCSVERSLSVTIEELRAGRPTKKILVPHSPETLRRDLQVPGAQAITLCSPGGKIYGHFIYYTAGNGVANCDDTQFVNEALRRLAIRGITPERVGVADLAGILPDVEHMRCIDGANYDRHALHRDFHAYTIYEARSRRIDYLVGTVRLAPCRNPVRNDWKELGYCSLGSLRLTYKSSPESDFLKQHSPLGKRRVVELLVLDVNHPFQDRFVDRKTGMPKLFQVPALDRDPSNGHTGPIPRQRIS